MTGRDAGGAPSWAGVDVGGSGVRVRVLAGQESADARCEIALPRAQGRVDVPQLCRYVLDELRPLMNRLGTQRLQGLGVGMTGLPGLVRDPAEIAACLRAQLEVEVVAVAGDALTTHLGALAGEPGAVVAAGTGVISLGTDLQQIWHQVDGWGFFVGDEGSGAWIGQRGLRAALRGLDGRPGGSPALREHMLARFGEPLTLIERVHAAESPAGELASFAPAVADAARSGDQIARAIWSEAGGRLAQAVVAAARELPARITWGGGLFQVGDLLHGPFREQVLRLRPGADLLEPRGTSLDGAVLLARRAAAGEIQAREPYLQVFAYAADRQRVAGRWPRGPAHG